MSGPPIDPEAEERRLGEDARRERNWKHWGPCLSERQWGTVREDYSPDGRCWESFPHDHAQSGSRVHRKHPFVFGEGHRVDYQPGESDTLLFGGNSNWRGPIWLPINYLLVEALWE